MLPPHTLLTCSPHSTSRRSPPTSEALPPPKSFHLQSPPTSKARPPPPLTHLFLIPSLGFGSVARGDRRLDNFSFARFSLFLAGPLFRESSSMLFGAELQITESNRRGQDFAVSHENSVPCLASNKPIIIMFGAATSLLLHRPCIGPDAARLKSNEQS